MGVELHGYSYEDYGNVVGTGSTILEQVPGKGRHRPYRSIPAQRLCVGCFFRVQDCKE